MSEADAQRAGMLALWERAAPGWARRAERVREIGMPVSAWMIEQLSLQPGQRVLELGAGPGDTGFLAAELVKPGGSVLCSDASEAMLEVARARAQELGIDNVEFRQLELEWIDLETASVDAVLCRWALMLLLDPAAALRESRRVLRPGGRVAVAVWDRAEENPWATIPSQVLVKLGYAQPPDAGGPGMFALAGAGRLQELLEAAGFVELVVESLELTRTQSSVEQYLDETLDLSRPFAETFEGLDDEGREAVSRGIAEHAAPFGAADGSLRLPARSLVAAASA